MDLKLIKQRLIATAGKYRYMILLVIAGILLLLLPTSGRSEKIQSEPCAVSTVDAPDMRKELELILSQIDGAGEVRVLLSMASGEETIYQTDTDESANGESLHTQTDTVIITNDSQIGRAHV